MCWPEGPGGEVINRILVVGRNLGAPVTVAVADYLAPAPIEVFTEELEEAPRTLKPAARAEIRRQGRRLWRVLRRLQNARPVTPTMDRISRPPPYAAAKRVVSCVLLGRH